MHKKCYIHKNFETVRRNGKWMVAPQRGLYEEIKASLDGREIYDQ